MFVKTIYVTESELTLHLEQDNQVTILVIFNMDYDVSLSVQFYV